MKSLDLDLMLAGFTDDSRKVAQERIEQLFAFTINKSNNKKELIVWKKLERDNRFGDRSEHSEALRRRAKIKRCDDWGRSIYGNDWRQAGAELVQSWEACEQLGKRHDIPSEEWMPPARGASPGGPPADMGQPPMLGDSDPRDADAGPLQYSDASVQPPARPPLSHHQVGSQLIQVRPTHTRKFWSLLRAKVGLEDCDGFGVEALKQHWHWTEIFLGSDDGSVLKETLLLANEFRSMFWSKRPTKCHAGVSMDANPVRYWGCYDQRLQDETGQPIRNELGEPIIQETGLSLQCVSHKHHNSASKMMIMFDREFMDQIVSVTTYLHNDDVKGHVLSYAKHFVFPNSEVDEKTTMYSEIRAVVDSNALPKTPGGRPQGFSMQQIAQSVDPQKGIVAPDTCAMVRWATVCKTGASLSGMLSDIMALGVGRKGGFGKTPDDEARALASIFSERGFVSAEHPDWVLSDKAGPYFKILVDARSKSQNSIVRFISKVVVDPLLAVASEPNFCPKYMMGLGSYPRALLRILSDVIWVNTGTRRRQAKIGHRVDPAATEWAGGSWIGKGGSLRLLNPKCGPAVQRQLAAVFREDWHPTIQQGIVTAVEVLLSQFQRIAAMHGPVIPDTAREIFAALHPHLYSDDDSKGLVDKAGCTQEETFPVKFSQLIYMFKLNTLKVISEIKDANRRELQSLDSFVGGMEQTEWTRQTVDGKRILKARAWALADAVVVKVMGRDVLAHFEAKFSRSSTLIGRDPLDFFPGFASLWGRHRELVDSFSGVEEPDEATEERVKGRGDAVTDESDDDDRVPPSVRPTPAHYNSVASLNAQDPEGRHIVLVDAEATFAKPLSAFPDAHRAAMRAATLSNSSTRVERPWSRMQQLWKGRTPSFFTLCLMFMLHNDRTMEIDLDNLDPKLLEAALELARHDGWKELFKLDEVLRDVMNADYKQKQVARSGASFWRKTNHDGSYRKRRWLTYTPRERKAMDRLIMGIKLRLGLEVPAKPRRQRKRQGEGPPASRPAAARQQANADTSMAADEHSPDSPRGEEGAADLGGPDDNLHHGSAGEDEQADRANLLSGTRAESETLLIRRSARLADGESEDAGQYREYHFSDADSENEASNGAAVSSVTGGADAVGEGRQVEAAQAGEGRQAEAGEGRQAEAGEGRQAEAVEVTEMAPSSTVSAEAGAPSDTVQVGSDAVGGERPAAAAEAEDGGSGSDSEAGSDSESEIDLDSPENDSEPFAGKVNLSKDDVWKTDFCEHVFNEVAPWHPRHSKNVWLHSDVSFRRVNRAVVADVTRKPTDRTTRLLTEQNIPIATASIKFTVECNSANLGYIRFDDFAGLQLVKVEMIYMPGSSTAGTKRAKPRSKDRAASGEDRWKATLQYRRLMTTREALETCDRDADSSGYLGRHSLRRIEKADAIRKKTTYHEGECVFEGDLRELIGVFRWHRTNEVMNPAQHGEYPHSDLLIVGGRAHERSS